LCAVLFISAQKGGGVNLSAKSERKVCAAKFFAVGFLTDISNSKAVLYFFGIYRKLGRYRANSVIYGDYRR